jgi:hypothetical protein
MPSALETRTRSPSLAVDYPDTLASMTFDPTAALEEALQAHGIRTARAGNDVLVGDSGMVMSAAIVGTWKHVQAQLVQLDVRVRSPWLGYKLLIESFAGGGADEDAAAQQAFDKFLQASMHVLLAALVDRKYGADQVEWEEWIHEDRKWQVCVGPLLMQGAAPEGLAFGKLLDVMQESLPESLDSKAHWLRVYFRKDGQPMAVSEALLDNEDWAEGKKLVEEASWPVGKYGARLFLMMMPG